MRIERELMRGAGPIAVLKLLESGEKYGYELVERLGQQGDGVLAMGQSTLYPMLYNLEAKKLVASRTEATGSGPGRPKRYYRLTGKGKRHLDRQSQQWAALVEAMAGLGIAPKLAGGAG